MQYLVVIDNEPMRFIERVEEFLSYGWRPQGGVAVCVEKGQTYLYQALVKSDATVEFVLKKAKECKAEFHPVFGECQERTDG